MSTASICWIIDDEAAQHRDVYISGNGGRASVCYMLNILKLLPVSPEICLNPHESGWWWVGGGFVSHPIMFPQVQSGPFLNVWITATEHLTPPAYPWYPWRRTDMMGVSPAFLWLKRDISFWTECHLSCVLDLHKIL